MPEHPVLTGEKLLQIVEAVVRGDGDGDGDVNVAVQLVSHSVRPGTRPGENFASEILAVDVVAEVGGGGGGGGGVRMFHWMVKLEPTATVFMGGMRVEEKEIAFYRDLLPEWKNLLRERGSPFELNCPEAPYAEFHPEEGRRSVLVLQNLRHLGYASASVGGGGGGGGLSAAHARLALEELAKFHALGRASLLRPRLGRSCWELLSTDYMYVNKTARFRAIEGALWDRFSRMVRVSQEEEEEGEEGIVKSFERFHRERGFFRTRDVAFAPNPDGFNVLCHGDAWYTNLLFKHNDSGSPSHCSLIDVSMTRVASPCTDLATLLLTSVDRLDMQEEEQGEQEEDLLRHYHAAFVGYLEKLGEDASVYPFRDLLDDYNKYIFAGFWVAIVVLPSAAAAKKQAEEAQVQTDADPDADADADAAQPSFPSAALSDADAVAAVKAGEDAMVLAVATDEPTRRAIRGLCRAMIRRGVFPSDGHLANQT